MLKIKATLREQNQNADEVRASGNVPGVIYGPKFASQSISFVIEDLKSLINKSSNNTKVAVELDGKEHVCIIKESQLDYMKNRIIHIDFMVLDDTKLIKVLVPLNFVGESLAVKKLAAVPKFFMKEVAVKCLPPDMPETIDVDLANLVDLDSIIHVSDLKVSDKVEILSDKLHSVATVVMPKRKSE
ncbi:50S ribosomal protein L25 [bacterium]|jgi:large subunit ribosomal protein L25|nr:50S ribosomal protein L25 [bacterium]MBT6293538.1 50S ribosomal protein L25 [bacterium]